MNKWLRFAEEHNLTPEKFHTELIEMAQASLAMELNKTKSEELKIVAAQFDGVYELTFKRIVK